MLKKKKKEKAPRLGPGSASRQWSGPMLETLDLFPAVRGPSYVLPGPYSHEGQARTPGCASSALTLPFLGLERRVWRDIKMSERKRKKKSFCLFFI